MTHRAFKKTILEYYARHRRDFPWRQTRDPYRILVSEVMLQQTQASRVVAKYEEFLKKFPTIRVLARASVKEVLSVWKGLGYNRRALGLKRAAEIIVRDHRGMIPRDLETLISLPSIGKATAGDLLAFAWNIPTVIIETNIRSVFIHFFFKNKKSVHDKDILPLIEKALDTQNPRDWYYALMDYGAMLKKTHGNASRNSAHYTRQSPFKGSNRELRSKILQEMMKKKHSSQTLSHPLKTNIDTIEKNLAALAKEGFIKKQHGRFFGIIAG